MEMLYLFISQFFAIQLLILNSKLIQNNRVYLAMVNSWLITLTQTIFIYLVANSEISPMLKFFVSGLGASLGCGAGYYLYKRFIHRT